MSGQESSKDCGRDWQESGEEPDYGPDRIHPTAGATAVGAREVLIAYNVNWELPMFLLPRRLHIRSGVGMEAWRM